MAPQQERAICFMAVLPFVEVLRKEYSSHRGRTPQLHPVKPDKLLASCGSVNEARDNIRNTPLLPSGECLAPTKVPTWRIVRQAAFPYPFALRCLAGSSPNDREK
jgi:hypothetical protein